ncbi:GNAT family N-acetyltransferase [Rhodococcus sp. B50]|uniref:GNAT family N-acetyltransferase n=1 Tax=Rhodococcus sp. B50 TaxID=2682847 RepID=UPI0027DE9D2A|nr:GNAT family N-acetyltransferase [Rhodococcus sp. B50]MBS9373858.1 hypothetical protein [Rhodococcus sp. B50]
MDSDISDPRLENISVVHAPQRRRYEILDGDTVVGFTRYRPSGARRVFVHTEVDPGYGGLGLAGRLVGFALADVAESGERIVPVCPYVAKYVRKHPEFDAIVDWPDASHATSSTEEQK